MYVLLDNQNYKITVESVATEAIGAVKKTVIRGWAVDVLRNVALNLEVTGIDVHVDREPRADLSASFELKDGERPGFVISVPATLRKFSLSYFTPGNRYSKNIDIRRIVAALRNKRVQYLTNRAIQYVSHAWTPQGRRALGNAIKRRFTKQQNYYDKWIARHETLTNEDSQQIIKEFAVRPLISIVVPVYNVDEVWLRKCVESVQAQWYDNWELCLADDNSPAPHVKPLLREFANSDSRIKVVFRTENGRISEATNSAIDLATGDYIGFMDNDDELAPSALFEVVRSLNKNPRIDFIYTDEDKITENGERFDPFFKPDFSPNLLLGHNYITHFVVVSKELLNKAGKLRSEYDGSQDYDFVLRATESATLIHHIPRMLYHWRTLASSVAGDPRSKMYAYEAGQRALESALSRRNKNGKVRMLDNLGTYKIEYDVDWPSVAVIASHFKPDRFEELKCKTDYLGDVSFIRVDGADVNQTAIMRSEEKLVFLDGVFPEMATWLQELVSLAEGADVGVVGGKVFDKQHRVLNAGVTLRALKSGEPFEMRGEWDEGIGYYFRDILPRDMFAVTEECMLLDKAEFVALDGFQKQLPAGLKGVDFCRRLFKQQRKSTLWEPYSEFVDLKSSPVSIQKDAITNYVMSHSDLVDPFASAYFPRQDDSQIGIASSVDRITVASDSRGITVEGWALDLLNGEDVSISLECPDWVIIEDVTRSIRPDVNTTHPVRSDAASGFNVTIRLTGNVQDLKGETISLILSTTTDRKRIPLTVQPSSMLRKLDGYWRKAKRLRHPRSTAKRIIDRYWAPIVQQKLYRDLIQHTEQYNANLVKAEIDSLAYKPVISLLVPVYNVDAQWLMKCVDSVKNQYYPHWQLCLVDDCSTAPHVRPLLQQLERSDPRINIVLREKNGHISRATNSALEIAIGEFVGLLDNDDELAPQALFEVAKLLNETSTTDLVYSDEDKIDEQGKRSDPHFKPDYSPDLLMSTNYISHFGVYRRSLVKKIGGFRPGYEGAQDYDLVLRFTEISSPDRIKHIPKVLYHWRTLATSTASSGGAKSYASDAGLKALQSAMVRRGIDAEVVSSGLNGIYSVHYGVIGDPKVSVIIPTKNGYDNIERCVNSIIAKTEYQNYEILIADNGSTNPHMRDLYQSFQERLGDKFRVEEINIPFNFSRINNLAAQKASGDYLLFLNDDTEVIAPSWMTRLVSFAQLDRVGVVGAKLYYPTETIQHAGIVLGLGGVAGHIQVGFPRTYVGYFGRLFENVNYYAVTAACCMVSAVDFWAVKGFDESKAVAYNDVDLCIRVHDVLGKDNVWAHEVELYHYESVTRGYDVKNKEKHDRLLKEATVFRKQYPKIVEDDPYYNPNLSRTTGNFWVREK